MWKKKIEYLHKKKKKDTTVKFLLIVFHNPQSGGTKISVLKKKMSWVSFFFSWRGSFIAEDYQNLLNFLVWFLIMQVRALFEGGLYAIFWAHKSRRDGGEAISRDLRSK